MPTINLPGADENIEPLNFGPSIVVSSIPNSPIRCKPIGNTPSATVPTINFPGDEEDHIARPAPAMPIILTDLASVPTPSIQSPTKSGRSLPQPPTGCAPPGGSSVPGIPTSSSGVASARAGCELGVRCLRSADIWPHRERYGHTLASGVLQVLCVQRVAGARQCV